MKTSLIFVAGVLAAGSLAAGDGDALADAAPGHSRAGAGRVSVLVEGLRSDDGDALLALFREERAFPKHPERAAQRRVASIHGGRARFELEDVPQGSFAVSILHDEDGDRKVRTGLFGIPREGIGFSRNARAVFGPPNFDDARLTLSASTHLTVRIRVHYY